MDQINPYWIRQIQALCGAIVGLLLFMSGLRALGATICAASLLMTVLNLIAEAIKSWCE